MSCICREYAFTWRCFNKSIRSKAKQFSIRRIDKYQRRIWYISSNKKEQNLGNFVGKEKSYRFEHLVFRLAAEEIVSISKAANLAGLKLSEFREKLDAIY